MKNLLRFCFVMLSWAVCANILAVDTPDIVANSMACDGDVSFTVRNYDSSLTYSWSLNTGTGSATNNVYTVNSPDDGEEYELTVTVTDPADGSTASAAASRYYVKTPAVPSISVNHNCGLDIDFRLDNNSSYPSDYDVKWMLDGYSVSPTAGEYTIPSTDYNEGDKFTLKIEVTNTVNGFTCTSSKSESVDAKVVPSAPTAQGYEKCETTGTGRWEDLVTKSKPTYTLNWYKTSSSTTSPRPESPAPTTFYKNSVGTKEYFVTQVNESGCESVGRTHVKVIVHAKPRIDVGSDLTICDGGTAVLAQGKTDENNVKYEWQPSVLLENSDKYSVTTKQLYSDETFTLTAYNKDAPTCSSTANLSVTVLAKPVITLSQDDFTICEDGQVTVENQDADVSSERYSWEKTTDNVNYTVVGAAKDLTLRNIKDNTTIKLTASLRALSTCSSEAEAKVKVVKKPTADAGPDRYICEGKSVQIGTAGVSGVRYEWDNAGKLNDATKPNPTVTSVTGYTKFTLTATSEVVSGCSSTDYVEVYKVDMPTKYNLNAGSYKYCSGYSATSGINVVLDGSEFGAEYMLVKNGTHSGSWQPGTGGAIQWDDVTAGRYEVKARTINPNNNSCEEYMNGVVVVTAEQSPKASISIKGGVKACPGEVVTIRVDITSGGGPYEFDLITDGGAPVTIDTRNIKYYEFTHTLTGPTTFEISRVKDGICERNYASTDPDYPILEMQLPNEADLDIQMSPDKSAACPSENVTLSVGYTGAQSYLWSTGATGRSINVAAAVDTKYELEIVTLEGCSIHREFNLDIIEEVPLTITLDHSSTDNNGKTFWYYCTSEEGPFTPKVSLPSGQVLSGGSFASEPAGLFDSYGNIYPKNITATTKYELIYTHYDVGSGCTQVHKEDVYVSAVNKEVDWSLAPAFDPPWPEKEYSKCEDDPASPVTEIRLQGHPKVDAGEWNIVKIDNPGGATSGATVVEINSPLAEAQLKNPTAGIIYHISYSVRDEFGCVGEAIKKINVRPRPTGSVGSIGFSIDPSSNLCKNLEEATIKSLNNPVKFILSSADNAMRIWPNANILSTELKINPSKGSLGSHYVIVDVGPTGCEDKKKVNFNIVNPIRITSFNIKEEYCEGDDPVIIAVTASVPTTGEIEITDELGGVVLSRTNINLAPTFNPNKAGKYTITYHYDDGTCDTEQSINVVVHPRPQIDFQMKSDYCFGEKIEMIPNYTGGTFTSDTPLPAGVLVDEFFDTSLLDNLGIYKINYEVTNEFGCRNESTTTFEVHGAHPMKVTVDPIFCEPTGIEPIKGFPIPDSSHPNDVVKFSSTRFTGITDTGLGIGTIDLSQATFNGVYPLTYHYIQEYTDAAGVIQHCETTTTEYFKVLNQTADFSGFVDGETICSDVVKIDLKADIKENSTFTVSPNMIPYPGAFTDNEDGTAVLYPEKLPEGKQYAITLKHQYLDDTTGDLICETEKTKAFNISKIEEVTDISLFCEPLVPGSAVENNIAVKLKNSELGIRYDLMVDGVRREYLEATTAGQELNFSPLTDEEATIQIIAVDPSATSCSRQMSKEFNIKKLRAFVKEKKNISCNGEVDGFFVGGVEGGVSPYGFSIIDTSSDPAIDINLADYKDSQLPQSTYEYTVTDAIGCIRTVDFEIIEPTLLDARIDQQDVKCFDESTAWVSAVVLNNSGTAPYSYSWVNLGDPTLVKSEATWSDVPAGTYEVTIKDANGCPKVLGTTVSAPLEKLTVVENTLKHIDVSIHGQSTGAIEIEVTGGTKDPTTNDYKEYLWIGNGIDNTNKNNQNLSNIVAGDYTVWVTDFNDCKTSLTIKVTEPSTFKAEETINHVSCNGLSDGYIHINVLGGTAPYTYTWTDANGNTIGNDKDIENKPAGTYSFEMVDSAGDVYRNIYTIIEPSQLTVKTSVNSKNLDLKCNGDDNAEIEIEVNGGTKEYIVQWVGLDASPIENNFKKTGLKSGTYTIDIYDANGCYIQHSQEVKEPTNKFELLNETVVQNKCHGASEGAIDINLTGGTPDPTTGKYRYSWTSLGGVGVDPTAEDQQHLKAGETYSVKAYDANDCTWEKTYVMNNPDKLTIALTTKDLTCNISTNGFNADGSVEADVNGGEKPYTYEWTKSSTSIPTIGNVITDLEEGDYEIKVTDNLGCEISAQTRVSQPELLTANVLVKDISCNEVNDGSLEVVPTGGTKDYTYAWYKLPNTSVPESTNAKIENLSDDVYSIKVLDANGCAWTTPVNYNSYRPSPIVITPTVQDVTIYGEATGIISLAINGGTPAGGYKVEWFRGPSIVRDATDPNYNADKSVLANLLSGDYYVVVTDANGCASDANIYVSQPDVISVDVEIVDLTCNKSNDGSITIKTTEGGDENYSYSWVGLNSGFTSTDEDISSLEADTYILTVTDGAGATFTKEYVVKEPDAISIVTNAAKSKLSEDCSGNSNGKITVDITGGTLPYKYEWIGVTANDINTVENLPQGGYSINLEDANGCKHNTYTEYIIGPAKPLAISSYNQIENNCDGDAQGVVEITVEGGTPDPITGEYRYLWTGAGIAQSDVNNQNQYNLHDGIAYQVTVIDALDCTTSAVFTLKDRDEIKLVTEVEHVDCFGNISGKLSAKVSGGTGRLSPKWEEKNGSFSDTNLDVFTRPAGEYIFTVTDDAGCVITKEVEIKQPDLLTANITGSSVLCGGVDDGHLYVEVTGGTVPYEYKWYKDDISHLNQIGFGAELTNLGKGYYEVFIVDRNGCEAYSDATILSSDPMEIKILSKKDVAIYGGEDGEVEISVSGGTAPFNILWSGPSIDPNAPATTEKITRLASGYYTVVVEDAVGCTIQQVIHITQPETITVNYNVQDIKCFGEQGVITLNVSGGNPEYYYRWVYPDGSIYEGEGPDYSEIKDLDAGTYKVSITDKSNFTVDRQFDISLKPEVKWTLHTSKTELDCYNVNKGNIQLEVSGGTTPYTIEWSGPNGYTNNGVYSIGNLGVGDYTAIISDANGCKPSETFTQEITQPDEIIIEETLTNNICSNDKSGKIELDIKGGKEPYAFVWSGLEVVVDNQNQENLPQGIYTLNFTDANGCDVKKEYKIQSNNEISARISGPSNVCSAEEFQIQIDVNGLAPWTIYYTDGTKIYPESTSPTSPTSQNTNVYPHTLLTDAEFKLVSVVDGNGCEAKLGESLLVDVHEIPQITIVSAQEDCCFGEPALMDIIFAGKGPWTINYTDGTLDYEDGPFTTGRDYLKINPAQIGTKTYTITSVSNDNCTVPMDYSVDVTAYTYPNLEVNIAPYICEPNPLDVTLHATGEAPWHVVYYLNDLKYEYDMAQPVEVIPIYPNKPDNMFVFESIKSGKRCVSKLDKQIQSQMGLLPLDAQVILGPNMVCRNSNFTFSTAPIEYATSYRWSLPYGFSIVSGLNSESIEVKVASDAVDGEIRVWGVNDCGEGVYTAINVIVDKPMPAGGEISIPPYVCDDESIFPLQVTEVENATYYEWVMPTGYNILSGQGSRSIMVQIDKYALTNQVTVIPGNVCAKSEPITATIVIRSLPLAEAGVDFITDCSDEAIMKAYDNRNAVSTEWKLVAGNAEFADSSIPNSSVAQLMYGENILSWTVNDGYCIGYDYVKVTNQNPGITQPEFSEHTICEDYMTLRAAEPEFGMGRWSLIAGDGVIENPNSSETLISGLSNKRTNVIRWEVYSPQCSNSINVEIISHDLNQLVDAGIDGVTTNGSFRLSARVINDSQIKGTWTIEAGEGVIEDPHNPNTVVTGLATGINTIRWTLEGYECMAYDEIKVRMVDEPIASFNIETTEGCEPLTVLFTNTTIGNAEYKWEFGDGSTSDLRSPTHIFEKAGTYTVKLTASANGRVDTYTGEVNVLPSPEAAFSVAERQLFIPKAEAHFYTETEGGTVHYWLFGDGGSSNQANPVYTYLQNGLYDITYIVSDVNMCSDTLVMEKLIHVGRDSYLVFPTAFTPNVERSNGGLYSEGERRLDIFYPVGRNVDTYKLEIFSSWGNKVFESNDQYVGWDGYYLGKCAAQGTYFYKAEGRFKDGDAFQYSGNLVLIR